MRPASAVGIVVAVTKTTKDLIVDLSEAFPRNPMRRETFRLYLRHLVDVPLEILEPVVDELICTSEFFPTIRAIREASAERSLMLPSEAAALEQIEARIAWARIGGEGDPPVLDPLVRKALDHVGGWHAFKANDEPTVVRGQFLRLFRELRAARIREEQVKVTLGAARPLAALPAPPT